MIKTAFWAVKLIISLILMEPKRRKVISLKKNGEVQKAEELTYKGVSAWADYVMKSTGSTINVYGIENLPKEGAMLFVSNHQSNFDIPLLLSQIPVPKGFIAKKELGNVPFITNWMKEIRCLFMDREDIKQSMQIIIEGIKQLKGGYSMVIFPEGSRSKSNTMDEFKAGSFKLATKSGVPVVPVTIDGTYKLFEGNGNRVKGDTVNLYIHKPIDTKSLTKDEASALHNIVHDIVASKLPKM